MDAATSLLLSLSISGSLLALILFTLKPLVKAKLSKSFQYYIWLLVLFRMTLPLPGIWAPSDWFGSGAHSTPPTSAYVPAMIDAPVGTTPGVTQPEAFAPGLPQTQDEPQLEPPINVAPASTEVNIGAILSTSLAWINRNLLFVWAVGFVASLGYRMACYSLFLRRIRASASAIKRDYTDLLAEMKTRMRISSDITIWVSSQAPVPMLVGLFKSKIILSEAEYDEHQLENILLHELTHWRRCDIVFKWFGAIVSSVHWFNPIVYFMQREIDIACELACDESVIKHFNADEKQFYGETLIDIANSRAYPSGVISTSMNAKQSTLKERLVSIMKYSKPQKRITALSMGLLVLLVGCAGTLGASPDSPSEQDVVPRSIQAQQDDVSRDTDSEAPLPEGDRFSINQEDIQAREKRAAEMAAKLNGKIVKLATYGGVHALLDEHGNLFLWGNLFDTRLDVPDGLPQIRDIALGQHHAVALDFDGKLHGWKTETYDPQDLGEIAFGANLPPFVQIDATAYHTGAITADGKVYKWGDANDGNQDAVPQNLGSVKQIATGVFCTAALLEDGSIEMWGTVDAYPSDMPVKAVQIACSARGVYALGEDGKVYGEEEQTDMQVDYVPKPEMNNIVTIAGCMALDDKGKVYAWGDNNRFQTTDVTDVPLNLPEIIDIATDSMKAIALGADGKIYEWGFDNGSMPIDGGERSDFVALPAHLDGFADMKPELPPIDTQGISETTVVKTFEEFRLASTAYPLCKKIVVDGSFTITDDIVLLDIALVVNEGSTITVDAMNCGFYNTVENNGTIIVNGRLTINEKPMIPGQMITEEEYEALFNPTGTGRIEFTNGKSMANATIKNSADIEKYFSQNSIYNSILSTPGEATTLLIDKDVTIPEGYSIELNNNVTIKIAEGVTLTNHGMISTYNEPIVEGTVVGNAITVQEIQ